VAKAEILEKDKVIGCQNLKNKILEGRKRKNVNVLVI